MVDAPNTKIKEFASEHPRTVFITGAVTGIALSAGAVYLGIKFSPVTWLELSPSQMKKVLDGGAVGYDLVGHAQDLAVVAIPKAV